MKLREKLRMMRKVEETNRANVERWKQVMAASVTGFVIDPVAGSTEVVRFFADDLPELFELAGQDDIKQADILLDNVQMTLLYREVPCKPVSVVGKNCSMTGTVIIIRKDDERLMDLTEDDIRLIRKNLATVYGYNGYPHRVLTGCSF